MSDHGQTLTPELLSVSLKDVRGPDKLHHASHGHILLSPYDHVVSSNFVMSSLYASVFCVFVSLFARRSKPVCTRRAMTDAQPIPRLEKMNVGEK